jgi:hypothetical protein
MAHGPEEDDVRTIMEELLLVGDHTHHSRSIEQGGPRGLIRKARGGFDSASRKAVSEHYHAIIADNHTNDGPIRVVKSGPNAGKVWLRV